MDAHALISLLLFICLFLFGIASIQHWCNRTSFPYTIALLVAGFLAQFTTYLLHVDLHLSISHDMIYFLLLPALLFEAAQHITLHQFQIQTKTISAFATVGVVISIVVVAAIVGLTLGLPVGTALLFGAIISATDPIAVLALFKSLGAPRRLALIADGESMFNDATGIIIFRVLASFVVAGTAFQIAHIAQGVGVFLYVFFGSVVFGAVMGYLGVFFASHMRHDKILTMVISIAVAFGSFAAAEHFFHLSGVISTVIAGIAFKNIGHLKLRHHILHFNDEMWGIFGFIALSLVFFFASYNLHPEVFTHYGWRLLYIVGAVLIARAVSVYTTGWITNHARMFRDEPNIPASWLHVLNWGGLRGVIPLVLAYSLPDAYVYKDDILAFTLSVLLFTLIVNGLTIKHLLLKLGLHLPKKEEHIIREEEEVYHLEQKLHNLHHLERNEFSARIIHDIERDIMKKEEDHKKKLARLAHSKDLEQAVRLQGIAIQREVMNNLLDSGHINETVHMDFSTQLDLQQDALEYPEIFSRAIDKNGRLTNPETVQKRIAAMRRLASRIPILRPLLSESEDRVILNRYALMRTRIICSEAVISYIHRVAPNFTQKADKEALARARRTHMGFINYNRSHTSELEKNHDRLIGSYQRKLAELLITAPSQPHIRM